LHQAVMAVGFYQRAAKSDILKTDPARFVVNHYNFDVRRDVQLTKSVHQYVLEHLETTTESTEILTELLMLERRLFGERRLIPVGGRQWLVLGVDLSELHTEAEIDRLLKLGVFHDEGNFTLSEVNVESEKRKALTLQARPEGAVSVATEGGVDLSGSTSYTWTIIKPIPSLTFRERLRENMLQAWVMLVALWISFWFIDEELITLISVIVLKYKQNQVLRAEAEKAGTDRIYIAGSSPNLNS